MELFEFSQDRFDPLIAKNFESLGYVILCEGIGDNLRCHDIMAITNAHAAVEHSINFSVFL